MGGSQFYSNKPLSKPAIIPGWRGPKHTAAWKHIQQRMYAFADENFGLRGREWPPPADYVFFPGGYAEFKMFAGEPGHNSAVVDLYLTGKMRQDMYVKYRLRQAAGPIQMTVGTKSRRLKGDRVATINLEIAWRTMSSQIIAAHNEMTYGRRFQFWTPTEQRRLQDALHGFIRDRFSLPAVIESL